MNRNALIALTLGVVGFGPIRTASADLIINGDFETPVIANNSYATFGSIPGWTSTIGAGIEIQRNIAGTPISGQQFVELDSDNNSNMYQDVATQAGQVYLLSFLYSPRPGIPASSNGIQLSWDGGVVANITGEGQGDTVWQVQNYYLTATQATTRLEFLATGTSDSLGGYIDAVSLNAVPEPSSLALCGLAGFGGVGYAWRRRNRVSNA